MIPGIDQRIGLPEAGEAQLEEYLDWFKEELKGLPQERAQELVRRIGSWMRGKSVLNDPQAFRFQKFIQRRIRERG